MRAARLPTPCLIFTEPKSARFAFFEDDSRRYDCLALKSCTRRASVRRYYKFRPGHGRCGQDKDFREHAREDSAARAIIEVDAA